ncbi:DUF5615 family PIN-like protein [Tautonia plasticadhaerens]|nr:DUF5615 family PIN-like protein [Tautonia plasticadhaerens]
MDHHIDVAITRGLRRRGTDIVTCLEDGTADWDDVRLLGRATDLGRVLFTQDDDHLAIAHRWQGDGRGFAGLIFARSLDLTVGKAIRDLELVANVLDEDDIRNRVEYLPL